MPAISFYHVALRPLLVLGLILVAVLVTFRSDSAAGEPAKRAPVTPFSARGDHIIDRRQTTAVQPAQGYSCSINSPCSNGACCGESGICGYGPTYCGSGCSSNCGAKAECGQYSATGNATCPLNVCCSQWGFCGTTEEFCDVNCQSNCGHPQDPGSGGDVRNLVIGYYESWRNTGKSCGMMTPDQIPVDALDQVNFAFIYIKPGTYDLYPMTGSIPVVEEVAEVARLSGATKAWISIGGWSFSDNNTETQAVFGDIASDDAKSAAFASKVVAFLIQYGYNGVDIDWEYPGAPDRGGTLKDIANYARMLKALRKAFDNVGRGWGISITLPTSYWYLRWFDLPSLDPYVDYFNLMAYDLHGVWDSTDPIGPYVYGHSNLTEIDEALDLFWRVPISPRRINLGLAFYGRSFLLTDPSCSHPGCHFSGPGDPGDCTGTAGILSFREIEAVQSKQTFDSIFDESAGVNYMTYQTKNGTSWISYDDKQTFQQKIDFANQRGLNGIFIWAVDQDDDSLTALKGVTGKDLVAIRPDETEIDAWNPRFCMMTDCGKSCPAGWLYMTDIISDANSQDCPLQVSVIGIIPNRSSRKLCCPAWGSPDPSTCKWRGDASFCVDGCEVDEVAVAYDNYAHPKGTDSKLCVSGRASYCCPVTNGNEALKACEVRHDPITAPLCSGSKSNTLTTFSIGPGFQQNVVLPHRALCCPPKPAFENCAWHGSGSSCDGNFCPLGQVLMAEDETGPLGRSGSVDRCEMGRKKVYCCDPPNKDNAFLPVPLDELFPETFPDDDETVFVQAFDYDPHQTPALDPTLADIPNTGNPNKEPFVWTIMVGASTDVHSLRRRDGSHLQAFECPQPDAEDYGAQEIKLVCMEEDLASSNCLDILEGGVRGTIVRLPENCGPDLWARAVSFRAIDAEDHPLPAELQKRAPENATHYRLRYDYNFRNLRRDGGEVYVRLDGSDHPGYWDEVVSSDPKGQARKREAEDWRSFHMDWFKRHGYIRDENPVADGEPTEPAAEPTKTTPLGGRGYGSSDEDDSWWKTRFQKLLKSNGVGIRESYKYSQTLYSASAACPPYASASADATVSGAFEATFDFGISLIGTLRNFNFEQAYAYFRLSKAQAVLTARVQANAGISIQTKVTPLTVPLDPWGGAFNVKGLWVIGPYMDVTAQLQAEAVISGTLSASIGALTADDFVWMYPHSMLSFPKSSSVVPMLTDQVVTAGTEVGITSSGSLTMTLTPSLGFQIKLTALGKKLVNTDIKASFSQYVTAKVTSGVKSCNGAVYAVDAGMTVDLFLTDPFPFWSNGASDVRVLDTTWPLRKEDCYPWQSSTSTASRGLEPDLADDERLSKRVVGLGPLFPDLSAYSLSCANGIDSDTGDCNVDVTPDNSDIFWSADASGAASNMRRSLDGDAPFLVEDIEYMPMASDESGLPPEGGSLSKHFDPNAPHNLFKRVQGSSKKGPITVCDGTGQQKTTMRGFFYPASGQLRSTNPLTYSQAGVETNCDDYTFDTVAVPPQGATSSFHSEHILEWQSLKKFMTDYAQQHMGDGFDNPDQASSISSPRIYFCEYFNFWWGNQRLTMVDSKGLTITDAPATIITRAIPQDNYHTEELTLLQRKSNNFKERLWGTGQIRNEDDMQGYVSSDPNKAINNVKYCMMGVNYMKRTETEATLRTQAERVGEYFDTIEHLLENSMFSNAARAYERLNIGDAWRGFINSQYIIANAKSRAFVSKWVQELTRVHLDGPGQSNPAIKARVEALEAAAIDWLDNGWQNPFNAAWANL